MNLIRRTALVAVAPALAAAGLALSSAGASAATLACSTALSDVNCQSISDHHGDSAIPPAEFGHFLQAVTGAADSRVIAVAGNSTDSRQDWAVHRAQSPLGSFVIKFAPEGDQSGGLCLAETGGLRSHVQLKPCNGTNAQRWYLNEPDAGSGFNVQNAATGFALTHVINHGVQVRRLFAGTGEGKRWEVREPGVL